MPPLPAKKTARVICQRARPETKNEPAHRKHMRVNIRPVKKSKMVDKVISVEKKLSCPADAGRDSAVVQ